jgi:hypothetical protein
VAPAPPFATTIAGHQCPGGARPPGRRPRGDYGALLSALLALPNVVRNLDDAGLPPLVAGDDVPPFWARRTAGSLYLFFAHPKARELRYPMRYGPSLCRERVTRRIEIDRDGVSSSLDLVFEPYQSLTVRITRTGGMQCLDIGYRPPEPACSD